MKSAAPPNRRHMLWVLAVLGVLLIPAVHFYRADRALPDGGSEVVPVALVTTTETVAVASGPVEVWHEQTPRAGVDASNFYKNAFVLYAALTKEEEKMLFQQRDEMDPDQAAALFKKIQPILDLLRSGAAADYCEWGLGEMSMDTEVLHLAKAGELGRLARWSARYRFPSDPEGALEDLTAQTRLSGHLADTVLGWAVQMGMEHSAIEVLRQNSGVLDEAALLKTQELLRSSTVEQNMARAFAGNASMWDSTAKNLTGKTAAERDQYLTNYLHGRPATAAQRQLFQDEAALMAELHYLQQTAAKLAEAMLWPDAQYQAWWKGVENSQPNHPLAEITNLQANTPIYERHKQSQVERAMLSAGLTLLQSWLAQPAQFRDPVTGAAFAYVEKPDGFELRSTVKNMDGKPVTMSFARPQ